MNQGFARELERVTLLFRELQAEFLITMEEKRKNTEFFLKGADMKQRDIDRAYEQGKAVSNGSLEVLLPKLKKAHESSNNELTERQEKIINILKSEKVASISPEKRKFMVPDQNVASAKNYGNKFNRDLIVNLGRQDSV